MKITLVLALITGLVLGMLGGGRAVAASGPAAPTPLSPANGGQVTVPFTISWSTVSDPSGIVAYNWQVSPSSNFSPVVEQNSTNGQTQDTVSGLANGTYFWRAQAVNPSSTVSPTPTPAPSGPLAAPTLLAPASDTRFSPGQTVTMDWSDVSGAASYEIQVSSANDFSSLALDKTVTASQFATSTLSSSNW